MAAAPLGCGVAAPEEESVFVRILKTEQVMHSQASLSKSITQDMHWNEQVNELPTLLLCRLRNILMLVLSCVY